MLPSPAQRDLLTTASALAELIVEPARELLPIPDANAPVALALADLAERTATEHRRHGALQDIAHELLNPLASIKGYAQLMQRRGSYDEQAITTILAQVGQLDRLIGDLRDYAGLEAGALQLQPGRMDLVALVDAVMHQTAVLSPRHRLRLERPDGLLEGWWDRGRLGQVFANLLGNAIKYSPAGSEILVLIEDLGSLARVIIEDHGGGIAPAALEHLFERGYRAPTSAAQVPGSGLGLHVALALVEAHGGQLGVESLLGQGSVFSCTLPRWRQAALHAANGSWPNTGGLQ
jgi:signal transduction histidine kinase